MFSFFFKPKTVTPDLSFIGVDMHSHLLPNLDDGLQSMEDTIAFIQELRDMGYKKLICTPHTLAEVHPNTKESILNRLADVKAELKARKIDFPIDASSEYMTDMYFEERLKDPNKIIPFGKNKNLVLIEMSYLAESQNIDHAIFTLQSMGLQPILAHPERYNFYHNHFEKYEEFKAKGVLLQSNLLSFEGYYGKGIQMVAEKLAKHKMVDLLGTDMHNIKHMNALKHLATKPSFYKLMDTLHIRNRELLLETETVPTENLVLS